MTRPLFSDVARPPRKEKDRCSAYYTCALCSGKEKMEVNHSRGLYYCHKCQVGGKLRPGGSKDFRTQVVEPKFYPSDPGVPNELSDLTLYRPLEDGPDFRIRYLREERNLSLEAIRLLAPHTGPEFDRVYFPIEPPPNHNGPVTFIGRSVFPEHTPKYKHPNKETLERAGGKSFWGFGRDVGTDIVLVEGIFDAVHAPNRLAVMGGSLTESQVGFLVGLVSILKFSSITVMLDGDALEASAKMLTRLIRQGFRNIYLVRLPYGKDPDSLRDTTEWEEKKERIA